MDTLVSLISHQIFNWRACLPPMFAIILVLSPHSASAIDSMDVLVLGLSRDHAVLHIDGKQQLLRAGEQSQEGILLLEANSESATLQYQEQAHVYTLGSQFGGPIDSSKVLPSVSLWPSNGLYSGYGAINGFSVPFLVDTGASAVALNAVTAQRIGIDFRQSPQVNVRTASGVTQAYEVSVREIQLGEIKLRNIRALVIDGPEPTQALLGMSFLNQVEMYRQGERLDLVQKFQ